MTGEQELRDALDAFDARAEEAKSSTDDLDEWLDALLRLAGVDPDAAKAVARDRFGTECVSPLPAALRLEDRPESDLVWIFLQGLAAGVGLAERRARS